MIMPTERAAGAVIFYKDKEEPKYLLLKHARKHLEPKEYWNFPKGHIEKEETPHEAAEREIGEETGLHDLGFIPGFRETEQYGYRQKGERVSKSVVWFLVRTKEKKITLSREHTDAAWLSYKEAYKKVFYPGTKLLLKKAHRFLARII